MIVLSTKESFTCETQQLWDLVVSLEHYSWRRGLSSIEILELGKKFIEHTKDGYSTTFTITVFEPLKRYEFDLENNNMKGHWTGLFSHKGRITTINVTQEINLKKWYMKPFAGMYLKNQQALYMDDLRKALPSTSI